MKAQTSKLESIFQSLIKKEKEVYQVERLMRLINKMSDHEDAFFDETIAYFETYLTSHDIHQKETKRAYRKSYIGLMTYILTTYGYRPKGAAKSMYLGLFIGAGFAIGFFLIMVHVIFIVVGTLVGVFLGKILGNRAERKLEIKGLTY